MAESSRKYENGKIYCIRNWVDDDIYVGSTTQALSKRFQKHRENFQTKGKEHFKLYSKMSTIGLEHFYIELIEECPNSSIEQMRAKEGEWIRQIGTLNGRIENRSRKQHYEENKEQILEKHRQYHQMDKEKRNAKNRECDEKHKERLAEMRKRKIDCDCGITYSHGNRLRHFNSKHHQNFLNNNINVSSQEEKQQQEKQQK